MLVLTRKPGERIFIGDDIIVTLISIRRDEEYGDRIRIGLDAPSEVPIRREEVPDERIRSPAPAAESSFDSVELESRQVGQKIEALSHQIARAPQTASPHAKRAGELSEVLISLRRRCDELLDRLGKEAATNGHQPKVGRSVPGATS